MKVLVVHSGEVAVDEGLKHQRELYNSQNSYTVAVSHVLTVYNDRKFHSFNFHSFNPTTKKTKINSTPNFAAIRYENNSKVLGNNSKMLKKLSNRIVAKVLGSIIAGLLAKET